VAELIIEGDEPAILDSLPSRMTELVRP